MLSKTKLPGMQASMFQARINWEGCGRKGFRRKKWTDDGGRGTNRPDGMASRWIVIAITHMPSKMYHVQEAQLSPRDRAMRRVSWNRANCHATLQKQLVREVLNKSKLRSWRVKVGRCVINMCTQPAFIVLPGVINKPTTVELCILPVYRRLAVAKFSKSTN